MTTLRVLLVDDEPHLLDALKRGFRTQRRAWTVHTVTSASDAIDCLSNAEFDVVVSDMRMPGRDGAWLLSQVIERWPDMIRIVLSGQCTEESVLAAQTSAHRLVSKPCEVTFLADNIDRCCELRALIQQPSICKLISRLRCVPSPPALFNQIMEEMDKSEPNLKGIAKIVEGDAGITIKLIQLANSPFFTLRHPVSSVHDAIAGLGLNMVKNLVLGLQLFSDLRGGEPEPGFCARVQAQSLELAKESKALVVPQTTGNPNLDLAFLSGLVANIGKLVLAVNLPKEYAKVLTGIKNGPTECECEVAVFGNHHGHIGGSLLGLWGLPQPVVEAVADHCNPSEVSSPLSKVLNAAERIVEKYETEIRLTA